MALTHEVLGKSKDGDSPHSARARSGAMGMWDAITSIPLLRNLIVGTVVFVVGYVAIGHVSPYRDIQLAEVFAYIIVVAGLSLLTGQNGQISLGHGALMMIGGYVAALLSVHFSMAFPYELLAATAGGLLAGLIFGVIAARLRGPYLAGATLALALALPSIPTQYTSIFGGDAGLVISQPSPPAFLGSNFTPQQYLAVIGLFLTVLSFIFLSNLMRSRQGRNFRVVRDDEVAAQVSGISVAKTQIIAFIVSAGLAGLGGALYTMVSGAVSPEGFTIALSIALLSAMVIGGVGSIYGSILGAVVLVYVPQIATSYSEKFNLSQGISANLALAVYGLLLIAVIILFPQGIAGGLRLLWAFARKKKSPKAQGPMEAATASETK